MDRTLQPEDRIAHYRVVGPLAKGGMGEVYIAQDQTLERNVALKVLPSGLVKNEERVRRFVTEAKSASSLSHPHIVTIYEIGQDRVRPGEDGEVDPDSDPVHYISMELITGETLKDRIHHERTDLKTLLGYLVQAAEGLAKAHASGIVHRDLKPGNIMISRDGYAKVLDFGLAKLTEREGAGTDATAAGATRAATALADATGEGVVLGTVGYMSPEQVRGKAVDHRSDIFSFGCILYEAATRRRPFAADSDVETMHGILNQQPAPVEEIAPETPNALRRLIRRCLAKSPDQRLQSMKDLAIELREIVDEFDTLSPSGSASSITPPPAAVPERRGPSAGVLGIAGVAVVAVVVAVWALTRGGGSAEPPSPPATRDTLTMTSLVSAERLAGPVISRDGRYLAYLSGPVNERSLWVRQVATGSQVRAAGPERSLSRISFSPDGNYVFFSMPDPESPNYSATFSVPSLGGTPRKRLFDVDSPLSFSPDGARAAFLRGVPQEGRTDLVVADLETREERVLASLDAFPPPSSSVGWSPDGRTIATIRFGFAGGAHSEIQLYDESTGEIRDTIVTPPGTFMSEVAWLPEGDALVASASDARSFGRAQICLISLPEGELSRVTNDFNAYSSLSIGDDGRAIAALRGATLSDLWTVAADGSGAPRQITYGGGASERLVNLEALPDGDLVFAAQTTTETDLSRIAADGSGRRVISGALDFYFNPTVAGGVLVAGAASQEFVPHVWRIDPEGGGADQLTDGDGELLLGLSPDGRSVLFTQAKKPTEIRVLPPGGAQARVLVSSVPNLFDRRIEYSPDGKMIRYGDLRERDGRWRPMSVVASATTGEIVAEFQHPPVADDVEWSPDGRGITFLGGDGEPRDVYRMTVEKPEPEAITRFTEGTLIDHRWSPDGTRLLIARRVGSAVSLWIVPTAGEPFSIASYPTGFIYEMCWLAGGSTIAFRYGSDSVDAVLVKGFR